MKKLLTVVSLLLSGVVSEAPAPYPASGWRPSGPAFDLPARAQTQVPQRQEYLPALDPRRPNNFDDNIDVSVQGLPTVEQQPIFQLSPINGQQYTGPSVNADIGKLNPSLQQVQYQRQLEIARQFARQREYEAALASQNANKQPRFQPPGKFAQTSTTNRPNLRRPQEETTTESIDFNEGEILEDNKNFKDQRENVSVEITKQNIQEYPPELFLNPLSQLTIQGQFVPLQQFGQLRGPVVYQAQAVPETQGYDGPAHLSALPSVLAQKELFQQQTVQPQFAQSPIVVQQEILAQAVSQYQPQIQADSRLQPQQVVYQPQNLEPVNKQQAVQQQTAPQFQPQLVYQQTLNPPNQYQPLPLQPQTVPQLQPQQVFYQPQNLNPVPFNQYQPTQPQDVEQIDPNQQPQTVQTYQPQFYQFQPSNPGQLVQGQPINYQNPNLNQYQPNIQQQYDPSVYQQPSNQGQGALQSGLNNQQSNNIDDEEKDTEDQDEGYKATAVATAFGTRTQPRVVAQYGLPSVPRPEADQGYQTTTEVPAQEEVTEDGPAVAEATAVATGRRSARLRSRRVRPIFTLDRSGHLVLAQQQ